MLIMHETTSNKGYAIEGGFIVICGQSEVTLVQL